MHRALSGLIANEHPLTESGTHPPGPPRLKPRAAISSPLLACERCRRPPNGCRRNCRPSLSVRSGHVGLGRLRFLCDQHVEVDAQRIVLDGLAEEAPGAMDVHQGLHAPCVEIVDMLMPQRD